MESLNGLMEFFSTSGTVFLVILLAEMGDKSQLVCMTLAARYRHWPVLLGTLAAFVVLNLLAVLFGAALAAWLPEWVVLAGVTLLFGVFGIKSLMAEEEEEEDGEAEELPGHGIFVTSFLLIFVAEFGDKTQLAVAGMATSANPLPVWLGATGALAVTSALGVVAGCTVLRKIPIHRVHQISGVFFLVLAVAALYRLAENMGWLG